MVVVQPLSTRVIKPNFCFDLPHQRSTTVSLETRNPLSFFIHQGFTVTVVINQQGPELNLVYFDWLSYTFSPTSYWQSFFKVQFLLAPLKHSITNNHPRNKDIKKRSLIPCVCYLRSSTLAVLIWIADNLK